MEIRSLQGPADIHGTHRVNAAAWRAAYDDILPTEVLDAIDSDPSATEARHRYERVTDQDGVYRLAVEDPTVLGYIFVRWGAATKGFVGEGEAGLKELYVDPDHWGEGIGTALLDAGLADLPEWVDGVRLEMLAANDVGAAFYDARGFDAVDEGEVTIGAYTYPTTIYYRGL